MLSVQPIQLWRYLGFKKSRTPFGLKRLFYLSWEDAFWDLLLKKKVPKSSYILVPEFYCTDVENNILSRGYKMAKYPVLENLSVDKKVFLDLIKKYNPAVVIIFHSVGIYNNLFYDTGWTNDLDKETILIEDSVHRVVNPEKIKIVKRNHFVIDSLRKVIPMQGANIFGWTEDLDYFSPSAGQSIFYSLHAHYLWLKMVLYWNLGLYQKAEKAMLIGYDLIGDASVPASGFILFKYLYNFINYDKIYSTKKRQIGIYKKYFKTPILFSDSDIPEMRGFPLVVANRDATNVLKYLNNNNLQLRYELAGSEWTKKRKIMYLPLGLHLTDGEIVRISNLVKRSINLVRKRNQFAPKS